MQNPGFFKRLILTAYDGLLLVALIIFTSAIVMGIFIVVAPDSFFLDVSSLDEHKITTLSPTGRILGNVLFCLNTVITSFFFYGWFWTHGGQTLGMKAWNLYLIKPDGKFINWRQAATRYAYAIVSWLVLGMGFAWILVNKRKLAWHDIATNTQIVYQAKNKKSN